MDDVKKRPPVQYTTVTKDAQEQKETPAQEENNIKYANMRPAFSRPGTHKRPKKNWKLKAKKRRKIAKASKKINRKR